MRVGEIVGGWGEHDLDQLVTSISRSRSVWLVSETRRTSTSSSGETVISSRVSMPFVVRANEASSAGRSRVAFGLADTG